MKRRPKVLFHASVGWMDRGSYCFGDFSPPEISSEFSGKSLIFLRPRERSIVLRSGKLFLFFCPGGEGMSLLFHVRMRHEKKSDNFCTAGYFPAKRCLNFSPPASSSRSLAAGGISALSSRVALYGVLISIYNLICFIPFHLLRSRKEGRKDGRR